MTVSKNGACFSWGAQIPHQKYGRKVAGGSATYGRQSESSICYDSERAVKLFIESHEPQGVK